MEISHWMIPLGIASYVVLFLAALSGLLKFKFKMRWINMSWHMWLGIAALVLASAHAAIVFFNY